MMKMFATQAFSPLENISLRRIEEERTP